MNRNKYKMMATIGVLTALSVILSYIKLPIIPPPFAFLTLEFADVPMVVALLLYGPVPALVISVLRNLLSLIITDSMGIGVLANLILDGVFLLAYALTWRAGRKPIKALIIACVSTVLASIFFNFAVFIPLYRFVGMYPEGVPAWYYIAAGLLPLNLVKWPLMSVLGYWLHKPVRRLA